VKKTGLIIMILFVVLITGCKSKIVEPGKNIKEDSLVFNGNETVKEEKEKQMIYMYIWHMNDLPRYGDWAYIRVLGMAIYNDGQVIYYDFGSSNDEEHWSKISQKEYIYNYLKEADLENDKYIVGTAQVDSERLTEYMKKLKYVDVTNDKTKEEASPSDSETIHEWTYYGVLDGDEPVFIFLQKELYDGATVIRNTDRKAQKAFEFMGPVQKEYFKDLETYMYTGEW